MENKRLDTRTLTGMALLTAVVVILGASVGSR